MLLLLTLPGLLLTCNRLQRLGCILALLLLERVPQEMALAAHKTLGASREVQWPHYLLPVTSLDCIEGAACNRGKRAWLAFLRIRVRRCCLAERGEQGRWETAGRGWVFEPSRNIVMGRKLLFIFGSSPQMPPAYTWGRSLLTFLGST